MPSVEFVAFAVKDALVAALEAERAVVGSPLYGVDVLDAWPAGRINSKDTVLVLDIDGDKTPATMRAGGGTRNETFEIDLAVAAVRKTNDAAEVRSRASDMARRVAQLVQAQAGAGAPPFGVANLLKLLVTGSYNVREFVHDKGRECDVRYRVQGTARLRP